MQKKLISVCAKYCATLGPVGYFFAPGTMGTLVTIPFVYALSYLSLSTQAVIILCAAFCSYGIVSEALKHFSVQDPSQIIIDELVGTLVTFFGIAYSPASFFVGFIIFRLFDIFKPCGIRYFEQLPGAYGVLLDDIIAGIYANILLRCLFA